MHRLIPIAVNETGTFQDDGTWLLSCSFGMLSMVSGFGLLESGRVSSKDEVNIMVKNVVDVVFGALAYWTFGFGFTFGESYPNPFIGFGKFFYDPGSDEDPDKQATQYTILFFQMSFSTTTSTIVSAAMAERIRLRPYVVITFLVTIIQSIAAHWIWSEQGFLYRLGCIDAAGCSVVHIVGGFAGLVSTIYLGPRQGRFELGKTDHMSNPTNALLGTFMLWWGLLVFNTGATLGIAYGRWRLAARAAVVTLISSLSGGCTSLVLSLATSGKCQINVLIDGLLASLVSTTAACHSIVPLDSLFIGAIAAGLAMAVNPLTERLKIDDPVGIVPVHVVGGIWGMICVGFFSRNDKYGFDVTRGLNGVIYSGNFKLLAIQTISSLCIALWACVSTFIFLKLMSYLPWRLRMTKYEEQLGADLVEHGLAGQNIAKYNIEKKINVKSAAVTMKYFNKWKRCVRRARELRETALVMAAFFKMSDLNKMLMSAPKYKDNNK